MKKFKKSRKTAEKRSRDEQSENGGKKKKRMSGPAIFALIVIVIMTASGIGFMWKGGGGSYEYGDHKFTMTNEGGYSTIIEGKRVEFSVLPGRVEPLNISREAVQVLKNTRMFYMTSDPESPFKESIAGAEYSIKRTMEDEGIYSDITFTGESGYNTSIVTCENATARVPVIKFEQANTTRIDYEGGCITLSSRTGSGFMIARDRLLYGFYGII
ncbi:MAG: hypothetical protein R6U32_05390 [Candidatus Woesearchaeota archaeon]